MTVDKKEVVEDELIIEGSEGKRKAVEVAEEAREKEYRHPSFGGQLFMGNFDADMLYPFPMQSAEDKKVGDEFIEKLTQILVTYIDPDEVDISHEIPPVAIKKMAELGVFAMKVPTKYGGLGMSQTNYARAMMKVASYCGSTAVLLSAHQSIGVPQPLKLYGTEAQKEKFFPLFKQGKISAFALTEEDVGSDPARMAAEAKLSEDGSHYILNGKKLWCTNGTIADVIIVVAKTAPKMVRGKEKTQISAFILDMKTPGVKVEHRCEFMGLKGIYNGVLSFTNVKIPKENLLGEEGRGLAMALATINVGRLTIPAACTGSAKLCLSICREWGNSRVQWGMPVGLHEAGREKIAYIAATTFAMEAITFLTCHWADEGKVDIRIEAAMSKLFCSESLWKIVDMTMQLRGGRGYETARSLKARGEVPCAVERAMRDCRINMIFEGSSEIMKLFLAREAMDPHLKNMMQLVKPNIPVSQRILKGLSLAGHYAWWYPVQLVKSLASSSYRDLGPLAKHFRFCERTSHTLAHKVFFNIVRYQQGLEKHQMVLGRLVEIGMELFVMAATCSYAARLHKENPKDKTSFELADYFCTLARRRIDGHLRTLGDNDDKQQNRLAQDVQDGKMKWLEEGIIKK